MPADRRWHVKFHREPAKVVALYDPMDSVFRPTVGAIIEALATDPKQFKKKHGKLDGCRAADATFRDGVVWRAVFEIDEATRTVRVLAFGPHEQLARRNSNTVEIALFVQNALIGDRDEFPLQGDVLERIGERIATHFLAS